MLHVARCPRLQDFSIYFYLMKTNRIIFFLIQGKLISANLLLICKCAEVEAGGCGRRKMMMEVVMMMQRCRVHTWQGWGGRRKQKRIDLCDLKSSIWTSLAREKVRRQKKARTIKNGSWLSIWSKHGEVDWYSELRLYHSINMRREGERGGCKFSIWDGWSLPPFTTSDTLNVKENVQYNVLDRKGSDER